MSMEGFLAQIPQAAASPYAYAAYAICAALFVLVGAKLRTARSVLKELKQVPDQDRRRVIESVTNSVIPTTITAEEWIRSNRNRSLFQLAAIVVLLGSAIIAIAILGSDQTIKPPPSESSADAEAQAFLSKLEETQSILVAAISELTKGQVDDSKYSPNLRQQIVAQMPMAQQQLWSAGASKTVKYISTETGPGGLEVFHFADYRQRGTLQWDISTDTDGTIIGLYFRQVQ